MKKLVMLMGILFLIGFFLMMFFGCATQEEAVKEEVKEKEVEAPAEEPEEKPEEELVKEEPEKEKIEKEEELEKEEEVEIVVRIDSDDDGVFDDQDMCPDTPYGIEVDEYGCPFDSDGDGVYDYRDMCPDTAYGVKVDSSGCAEVLPKLTSAKFTVVLEFDINSAGVRPIYYTRYEKEVERLIKENPEAELIEVIIRGHSDSTGSKRYNYRLSERRANSVKSLIVDRFSVDPAIIKVQAFGENMPIASNKTKEGRQRNRRVEVILSVKNLRE